MNTGKGNMVLLTVMSIATLLVAVVGATFAYFGALIKGGETSPTFEVTSGTLSTEYNGNSSIDAGLINQGEIVGTKEIDVTGIVTGSNNFKYEVTLDITNNNYAEGELFYTITSTNESSNGQTIPTSAEYVAIPTGANTIAIGTGVFAGPTTTGLKHKYVITIVRNATLDETPDKTFNARFYVAQAASQTKK